MTRRFVLTATVSVLAGSVLAGCAAKPIAIDREAMAGIKRIAMPAVAMPANASVEVTNAVSRQFGLIGLIAGETVRNNRIDALNNIVAARGLLPNSYLADAVRQRLEARQIEIVPEAAPDARRTFLNAYPPASSRDAVLDIVISQYGFVALSDADMDHYKPVVRVAVRLVSARDASVLMQDSVYVSGISNTARTPDGQSVGTPDFATFTEIEHEPDRAVTCLRLALLAAADGIVARLA